MKKYTPKGFILLVFLFSSVIFNYANAHSTITYAYPSVDRDLNVCMSKAKNALKKSGYQVYTSRGKLVGASKGEYRAIIACDIAQKTGVAFIILNGAKSPVKNELNLIYKQFVQAK